MLSKNLSHAILKDDLLVICPTVCHRFCIFQVLGWQQPSIRRPSSPGASPEASLSWWRSNIEREWNGLISCIYKSWWNFSSSQNRNNTIISILNLPESPSTTRIFIHYRHHLNCSTDNSLNFLTKSTGEHLGLEVHHILHLAAVNSIRILERKVGSRSNTPPLTPLHHSSGSLQSIQSSLVLGIGTGTPMENSEASPSSASGDSGTCSTTSCAWKAVNFQHKLWQKKWHKWRRSGWNRNLRSQQNHDILSG